MTRFEPLLVIALAAPVAGVGVLRLSWSRAGRSAALNTAGWALLLTGALCGGLTAGAWGIAVSALGGMGAAGVALAWAAATAPAAKQRASNRRVGLLPEPGEPRRIWARILTFVLVAIAGLLLSLALTVAVRGAAARLGAAPADAIALAFFTTPISWAMIAYFLLMQESRRRQLAILGWASLPLIPVLALEFLA